MFVLVDGGRRSNERKPRWRPTCSTGICANLASTTAVSAAGAADAPALRTRFALFASKNRTALTARRPPRSPSRPEFETRACLRSPRPAAALRHAPTDAKHALFFALDIFSSRERDMADLGLDVAAAQLVDLMDDVIPRASVPRHVPVTRGATMANPRRLRAAPRASNAPRSNRILRFFLLGKRARASLAARGGAGLDFRSLTSSPPHPRASPPTCAGTESFARARRARARPRAPPARVGAGHPNRGAAGPVQQAEAPSITCGSSRRSSRRPRAPGARVAEAAEVSTFTARSSMRSARCFASRTTLYRPTPSFGECLVGHAPAERRARRLTRSGARRTRWPRAWRTHHGDGGPPPRGGVAPEPDFPPFTAACW